MELDKRIIEGKKPLTCFDLKEAEEFEGKEGYFSDYPRAFADGEAPLEKCATTGILELDVDRDYSICPYINKTTCLNYPYFLPTAWIKPKEPEKKYRPYTLAEWADKHEIGEIIHFSYKDGRQEFNVMYTGYVIEHGEDVEDIRTTGRIMLMGTAYFLEDLFENYVICIDGEWQPFGVMEE